MCWEKNWAGACFAVLMERLEDAEYALITICKDANNYYPSTSVDTQVHSGYAVCQGIHIFTVA